MAGIPVFNLAGAAVIATNTATVAWPVHAAGDVALLVLETAAQVSTLVTAAGFVEVTNGASGSPQTVGTAAAASAVSVQVFWKRATTSSEANVTCADAGDHVYARIFTFTNCVTAGTPYDIVGGGTSGTSSTNASITSAVTTTADCLIVTVLNNGTDSGTSQVSTWTNANQATPAIALAAQGNSSTGLGGGISVATGGLKLKGATGVTTATLAAAGKKAFLVIALKPDPPSGSGNLTLAPGLAGTGQGDTHGTGGVTLVASVTNGLSLAGTGVVAKFDDIRQAIIDGLDSDGAEGTGWDAVVKAGIPVTAVVRTTASVVTITLPAFATYDITGTETITVTVPASAVKLAAPITATPTFAISQSIANVSGSGSMAVAKPTESGTGQSDTHGTGSLAVAKPSEAGSGRSDAHGTGSLAVAKPAESGTGRSDTHGTGGLTRGIPALSGTGIMTPPSLTGTGNLAVALSESGTGRATQSGSGALTVAVSLAATGSQGFTFDNVRQSIINGLDSDGAEGTGWDAVVKAGLAVTAVVRTSDTVVTITLPAFASFNIASSETITATIPASALALGQAIVATPTVKVAAVITGTGNLTLAPAEAGTGIRGIKGSGSLAVALVEAGSGSIAGAGTSGGGGLTLAKPTLAATGQSDSHGTGSLALARPALSGAGRATQSGSGGLALARPAESGSGRATQSGTGSLAVPKPTEAGTGSLAVTHFDDARAAILAGITSAQAEGTGWNALKGTIPLTAVVRTTASVVTITVPALATYNITANETLTVTVPAAAVVKAAPIVATPTFGITSAPAVTGSGGLTLGKPGLASSGEHHPPGTGTLAVPKPALAGSGTRSILGSGTLVAPLPLMQFGDNLTLRVPAMAGAGSVILPITGSGSLAVAKPTLAATGAITSTQITGTGALTLARPGLAGTGLRGILGTGNLTVQLVFADAATITQTGSGALALAPALAGTGITSGITAIGSLALAPPVSFGDGNLITTGTGGLFVAIAMDGEAPQQQNITAAGAVELAISMDGAGGLQDNLTGTGDLAVLPSLDGTGWRTIMGEGALSVTLALAGFGYPSGATSEGLGRYRPEHNSAYADVGGLGDFVLDHQSVGRDVGDAGV